MCIRDSRRLEEEYAHNNPTAGSIPWDINRAHLLDPTMVTIYGVQCTDRHTALSRWFNYDLLRYMRENYQYFVPSDLHLPSCLQLQHTLLPLTHFVFRMAENSYILSFCFFICQVLSPHLSASPSLSPTILSFNLNS